MNTSPNSVWFYAEGSERKGPIPFSRLQILINEGLPTSSLVWTEGMPEWTAASSIPDLVGGTPAAINDSNPYAAPAASATPASSPFSNEYHLPAQPIPLDVGFCFGRGFAFTKAYFGKIILFGLVYFIISGVAGAILQGIATSIDGPPTKTVINGQAFSIPTFGVGSLIFVQIANGLVSIFLMMGSFRFGHRLLNGEDPGIEELFSQGSKILGAFAAYFLYSIIVVLGLILLVVPGIILAIRLGFYLQAITEKNLGPIEALKYSWNLTRTNGLSLFGFYILSFLIVVAGLLALIVGLLWAIPTATLALLIAFRYLHFGPNCVREP